MVSCMAVTTQLGVTCLGYGILQLVMMTFSQTGLTEKTALNVVIKATVFAPRRLFGHQNGRRCDTITAPHLTADTGCCAEQTGVQTNVCAAVRQRRSTQSRCLACQALKNSAKASARVGGLTGISPATHSLLLLLLQSETSLPATPVEWESAAVFHFCCTKAWMNIFMVMCFIFPRSVWLKLSCTLKPTDCKSDSVHSCKNCNAKGAAAVIIHTSEYTLNLRWISCQYLFFGCHFFSVWLKIFSL